LAILLLLIAAIAVLLAVLHSALVANEYKLGQPSAANITTIIVGQLLGLGVGLAVASAQQAGGRGVLVSGFSGLLLGGFAGAMLTSGASIRVYLAGALLLLVIGLSLRLASRRLPR
jgi:hypothetical protein